MKEATFTWELWNLLEPNERIFKLSEASVSPEGAVTVTLLVKPSDYQAKLDENVPVEEMPLRLKINSAVKQIVENSAGMQLPVFIKYRKTITDVNQIKKEIFCFINEQSRLLVPKVSPDDIIIDIKPDEYVAIKIGVSDAVYSFCIENNIGDALKFWLDRLFMEDSSVEFDVTKKDELITVGEYQAPPLRTVEYQNPVRLFGKITIDARYISDILEIKRDIQKVCVTGRVIGFKVRTKKADPTSKFYLFRLDDTSGMIDVKVFPKSEAAIGAIETVENGQYLVVEGPMSFDNYNNCYAITAFSYSRIDVDYKALADSVKYLDAPNGYFFVTPQPYIEEETYNLSMYDTIETELPKSLADKTYVIFDTETTGKTMNEDEIIEIAAVKMVNGKFTETFTSLVKPMSNEISQEIIDITHITPEMVAGAPKFSQIAGDIKLFFGDAPLVAYNASFDMGMINPQLRKCGYNLDNEVIDAYQLALDNIKSPTNYKLTTVCELLDIPFEGAHRSLNDTIATAKLFRKLAGKMK